MALEEFTDILVQINLEKSDEALRVAKNSIDDKALMSALNRIYYSIFYTVNALAIKNGFKTSKHRALLDWFNEKFIYEKKLFDPEIYKIFQTAFKYRQKGDYDDFYKPEIEMTKDLYEKAVTCIETIRKYMSSEFRIEN